MWNAGAYFVVRLGTWLDINESYMWYIGANCIYVTCWAILGHVGADVGRDWIWLIPICDILGRILSSDVGRDELKNVKCAMWKQSTFHNLYVIDFTLHISNLIFHRNVTYWGIFRCQMGGVTPCYRYMKQVRGHIYMCDMTHSWGVTPSDMYMTYVIWCNGWVS